MTSEPKSRLHSLLKSKQAMDSKQLAKEIGLNRASVIGIATRNKNPSAETANKIIHAFGVRGVELTLADIVGPAEQGEGSAPPA